MTERSLAKPFEPMLGTAVKDLTQIVFPVYASPKFDGFRCCARNGEGQLRSLEGIPNEDLMEWFRTHAHLMDGLDGELISGSPTAGNCLRRTNSAVTSEHKELDDLRFFVFDDFSDPRLPFKERYEKYRSRVAKAALPGLVAITQTLVHNLEELLAYEAKCVAAKYEGTMLKDPEGIYKYGRSTVRERGLTKMKRFEDEEILVTGYIERMHNTNELQKDKRGHAKRSHARAGLVPAGDLGSFVGTCPKWPGEEIKVGGGIPDDLRKKFWLERGNPAPLYVKFKHMPYGSHEAPRHAIFLDVRHPTDMSTPSD